MGWEMCLQQNICKLIKYDINVTKSKIGWKGDAGSYVLLLNDTKLRTRQAGYGKRKICKHSICN